MKVDGIYSIRDHKGKVYTDIVYEWEEDLSRLLGAPILKWGRKHTLSSKIAHRAPFMSSIVKDAVFGRKRRYLRFVMNALEDTPLFNHPSCVPVIIDYFVADNKIADFARIYDRCELVLISSRQAYDRLAQEKLPFRIAHLPLTLSDRYLFDPSARYQKKYNLTLLGSQIYDGVLKGYLRQYCQLHPEFIYVSMADAPGQKYYTSRGEYVCDASDRTSYMELLRASRITIYSTPGLRGHRGVTHGYDQVTPKFLEMLAAQCQVITRYSHNSDAEFFGLPSYSPSIDSYEAFRHQLDLYLCTDINLIDTLSYLRSHTTSRLTTTIQNI